MESAEKHGAINPQPVDSAVMAMAADVQETPKSAPAGLLTRAVGVLVSPRPTFEGVVAHPRWFGILALTISITAALGAWLVNTEVGRQAAVEQSQRAMESFGMQPSDEQMRRMEEQFMNAPAWRIVLQTVLSSVVGVAIVVAALSGLLLLVFTAILGGEATYRGVLAVVAHAGVIFGAKGLFETPLNYFRGSMSSPANLGVFVQMLDEKSFVARALGMIDLFFLWWILVLAIGLSVLYRKRTQPVALSLYAVYLVIVLGIAGVMSMM